MCPFFYQETYMSALTVFILLGSLFLAYYYQLWFNLPLQSSPHVVCECCDSVYICCCCC